MAVLGMVSGWMVVYMIWNDYFFGRKELVGFCFLFFRVFTDRLGFWTLDINPMKKKGNE